MATFRINRSFYLPSRKLFVLAGEILTGEVRAGMAIGQNLNSVFVLSHPIDLIEFARTDRGEDVCLCFNLEDATDEDLDFLRLFWRDGEVYQVLEPTAAA